MSDVDLTEAVEAMAREYAKQFTPVTWESLTRDQRHRMLEGIMPLAAAAAPLILSQCPKTHMNSLYETRLAGIMRKQAQTLTEERNVARRALVTLGLAVSRVTDLCNDPGGPDSWSHTFEGRSSVFVDDVLAALVEPIQPLPYKHPMDPR